MAGLARTRLPADLSLRHGCEAGLTPGSVALTPGPPDARYFSAGKGLDGAPMSWSSEIQGINPRTARSGLLTVLEPIPGEPRYPSHGAVVVPIPGLRPHLVAYHTNKLDRTPVSKPTEAPSIMPRVRALALARASILEKDSSGTCMGRTAARRRHGLRRLAPRFRVHPRQAQAMCCHPAVCRCLAGLDARRLCWESIPQTGR